ncbi:MAG: alkylmercury lyase family protein [Acidobacteriota bacterium]|nr:alkylmercury lyase family protein [Acidobacteriota bacterium]
MTTSGLPEQLHYLLTKHVIETGHTPNIEKLAEMAQCPLQDAQNGIHQLARIHGVILVPNSVEVWSLHPFALMPTRFWVSSKQGGWWANCAWCSLGIGAALHEDVHIVTGEGAEGTPLEIEIKNGQGSRPDVLMHFPYPPARWWDNPYAPCGNILFFSSPSKIESWCTRHKRPRGAVLTLEKGVALAEAWFGDYASPEWRRKTSQNAERIFAQLQLDPAFWNIPKSFQ